MRAREDLVGKLVAGRYVLKRLVGSGAMGAIYEGVHASLGRRVAVKVLPLTLADDPDLVARFRREARAMSVIASDYIVQIFDVGEEEGVGLYMVLELLSGEDLEHRIQRERRVDVHTAVTIGYQVARGLARAHVAGVIHRDLKPANIFLTERDDGSLLAKILDFGISKLRDPGEPPSSNAITRPGVALGTPQYMAPEQIQARDSIDGRADVWSLSVVLYEVLAGSAPFAFSSYVQVLESIVKRPIPHLASIAPWVPRALSAVIMAGLERDPELRPASAGAFAQEILHALPVAGLHASGAYPSLAKAPAPAREPSPAAVDDPRTRQTYDAHVLELDASPDDPASTKPRVQSEVVPAGGVEPDLDLAVRQHDTG